MVENTKITQRHISSAVFLLVLPIAAAPLVNLVPQHELFNKLILVLCFWVGCSQYVPSIPLKWCSLVMLCFASVLWSVSPPLSAYQAIQLSYYAMGFLLLRRINLNLQTLRWGTRLIVLIALLIAFDGLHQYFFRYNEYARYLQEYDPFGSQEMEQVARTWINALSGRVFTQFFALPSQLAGYLLMILPLNVVLIFQETRRELKVFWSIVLMLNGLVFFFTKSFGAWLVFLCMLVVAVSLWLWNKRILSWAWFLKIGSGFLIAAIGILFLIGRFRGQYLWNFQGNNPLWHRFLNWKTAFAIWRDHPLLGSGLSTFGAMYPQYMQPGANEAQYAHNTYLQFGAELGIVGFILIMFFVGNWCFSVLKGLKEHFTSDAQEKSPDMLYGLAGSFAGLGFLLHNIVDFDFYVFPLGLLGLAMLGLGLNIFSGNTVQNSFSLSQKPSSHKNHQRYLCSIGLIGISTLLFLVKDWQYTWANHHKKQAVALLQTQQYQEALQSIQSALRLSPTLPEYHAITGSILLYLRQPQQAIDHYRTAIEIEPVTPWFHAGLAEAYLQQQNLSLAYIESRQAAELFPLKSQYQQRVQHIQKQLPQ